MKLSNLPKEDHEDFIRYICACLGVDFDSATTIDVSDAIYDLQECADNCLWNHE